MKYIKKFESKISDNIKKIFGDDDDVYYINKDNYNYPDGFNRYFKRGDTVVLIKETGWTDFNIGDKFRILRMEGQNAKVINLRNTKIGVVGLERLLHEKDYELYNSINKFNL